MDDRPVAPEDPGQVTRLLQRWSQGDERAMDELMPLIYDELKRLASHYLRLEGGEQSLPSTALAHEAYLRLAADSDREWKNRVHFFAVASRIIRHILVDHARRKKALKRDVGRTVSLDEALTIPLQPDLDVLALDESMQALATFDSQKSRVVELRYFGGLSIAETAEVLHLSKATVNRDWAIAKLWLYRNMRGETSV